MSETSGGATLIHNANVYIMNCRCFHMYNSWLFWILISYKLQGLVYLETGGRSGMERAVAQLVEAARLDPREADVFRYLGHYYRQIAGDTRRAARSYQKAIMLDPEDAEAGV